MRGRYGLLCHAFIEEHDSLRKTVRDFVKRKTQPHVDACGGGADEIMLGIIAKGVSILPRRKG